MSAVSSKPLIMGILNVTPDSFSDGGSLYEHGKVDVDRAVQRVFEMMAEGADIIDIGGESSGPGSKDVSLEEELARVIPVVREIYKSITNYELRIKNDGGSSEIKNYELEIRNGGQFKSQKLKVRSEGQKLEVDGVAKQRGGSLESGILGSGETDLLGASLRRVLISVDTYKAEVARQALEAGADMINDVTAFRGDENMARTLAQFKVPVVIMYAKDLTARTTRERTEYRDVMATVADFLEERITLGVQAGIARERFILDPGMGAFVSADPKYSLEILRRLAELKSFGLPILVGASKKGFIGEVLSIKNYELKIRNDGQFKSQKLKVRSEGQKLEVDGVAKQRGGSLESRILNGEEGAASWQFNALDSKFQIPDSVSAKPLPVDQRLEGSLACAMVAMMNGASILRVHDVQETRRMVDMIDSITN